MEADVGVEDIVEGASEDVEVALGVVEVSRVAADQRMETGSAQTLHAVM